MDLPGAEMTYAIGELPDVLPELYSSAVKDVISFTSYVSAIRSEPSGIFIEIAPVFSDSELKISQDERNKVRTNKNKICFFITTPIKSFKPLYYTPPPTNVQDKYCKYNKNLQKKAVPKDSSFLLPGNASFLP